jgi:DNA polymerase sigma
MDQMNLHYELLIYGSTVNGLALHGSSDLDLSLIILTDSGTLLPITHHHSLLSRISSLLSRTPHTFRAPELRPDSFGYLLTTKHLPTGTDIELLPNKVLEVYNSHLIRDYSLVDSRFHKLALIVKYWNKGIGGDKSARLNSYSVTLMLIAYMVHRGSIPKMAPDGKEIRYFKYKKD